MSSRIPVTQKGAVKRARDMDRVKPSVYKLGAGGRNPAAPTPFTIRDKVLGCDCSGFVLWCLGMDRLQDGVWYGTDMIIGDAKNEKKFFTKIDRPELGCLVVYPSIYDNGKRTRIGHVGIVVEVPAEWDPTPKSLSAHLKKVKVIDCAGSKWRKLMGDAIRETTAAASWNKKDAIFVRYNFFVPDTIESILAFGKVVA